MATTVLSMTHWILNHRSRALLQWPRAREWKLVGLPGRLSVMLIAVLVLTSTVSSQAVAFDVNAADSGQAPSVAPENVAPVKPVAETSDQAAANSVSSKASADKGESDDESESEDIPMEQPWDYWPYRVKIWISGNHDRTSAARLSKPLQDYLDRSFMSVWQMTISDAPSPVSSVARRDFGGLNYQAITSSDPVFALKRNHPETPRVRFSSDIAQYIKSCLTTADRKADVLERGVASGNETLDGIDQILKVFDGDSLAVSEAWKAPETEALLLTRGMAAKLKSPDAKIIELPLEGLVGQTILDHDKVFIIDIDAQTVPMQIKVLEIDCLMRNFSPVVHAQAVDFQVLPEVVGQAVIQAFAPIVRIEDAGTKNALGLVRGAQLILGTMPSTSEDINQEDANATDTPAAEAAPSNETADAAKSKNAAAEKPETAEAPKSTPTIIHPALIQQGDFLQPMIRRDDRNGNPIALGPLPWAYLHTTKVDGAKIDMELYAGQTGGLQGRKNKRTHRMALKVRPVGDNSVIRLHAKGAPTQPLAGYEFYEKELKSTSMTFVGRTNWNGEIEIAKGTSPMRLLYVKNGGAVLARLPIVPGATERETADLVGDDQRLRAEAYIRGTQNAIVDLIAIRTLLGARIRLKLEKGQMAEAKELLLMLEQQPTYEVISADMAKKIIQIKGRNPSEQKRIENMFAETREMLVKNINSTLIRELEAEVKQAEANGGSLKRKPKPESPEVK